MSLITNILAVAGGGAAGAVARYLLSISPLAAAAGKFPLATFVINVTGSFVLGLIAAAVAGRGETPDALIFAMTVGFLGAFTTFSTFELEIFTLISDSQIPTAFLYLFLSVATGFAGVAAGAALGSRI